MMSRSKRLQVVLELVGNAEHNAAKAYGDARRMGEESQLKLDSLVQYCREYEDSSGGTQRVLRAEDIVRQRSFLEQIYIAKQQQVHVVKQCQKLIEQKKQAWHKAHLKHQALQDLLSRLREDEQKALTRKEDKMLDEWFAQSQSRSFDDGK